MARSLMHTIHHMTPDGEMVTILAGTSEAEWPADIPLGDDGEPVLTPAKITNPAAWEPDPARQDLRL